MKTAREQQATGVHEMPTAKTRIERIHGYEDRLYGLVAPFVMNPEVIRQNDGYPFSNTEDHVWYISLQGRNLVRGFLSVCDGRIRNDFTWQDSDVLEELLRAALRDMEKGAAAFFTAVPEERPLLEKLGFGVQRKSSRYIYMTRIC